jgi:Ca2+-binding RTX toxin-like protein
VTVTLSNGAGGATGGGGNDIINGGVNRARGSAFNDALLRGAGVQIFEGQGGNDTLVGGGANDTLNGGDGFDSADYGQESGTGAIVVNLGTDAWDHDGDGGTVTAAIAAGTAIDTFGTTDTLIAIERVRGTNLDDYFRGGDGQDTFVGRGGVDYFLGGGSADFFYGGSGNDVLDGTAGVGDTDDTDFASYDNDGGSQGIIVNFAATAWDHDNNGGTAAIAGNSVRDSYGDVDSVIDMEAAIGTNFVDYFRGGNVGNDAYEGFAGLQGNDYIDGGSGNDEVRYDFDERYTTTTQGVIVNLSASAVTVGSFTVAAGTARDSFGDTDTLVSIEYARGTKNADVFFGGAGSEQFRGLAGNDILNGGGGIDTADYIRDASKGGTQGIIANMSNSAETWGGVTVNGNQVKDGFGTFDTLVSIERIRGTDSADAFFSGAGNDRFVGAGGNDNFIFSAGNGADWIGDFEGGAGAGDIVTLRSVGGFTSFSDVLAHATDTTDVNGDAVTDVVIDLGGGNSLALLGRSIAGSHTDDFLFL